MDERILYGVGGAIAGALVGAAASYYITIKKLEKAYEDALNEELEATKRFYTVINKTDYPTPEDLVREKGLIVEAKSIIDDNEYGGEEEEKEAVEEVLSEVSKNIFTNYSNGNWDAEAEEAKRDVTMPYVISHDEFFENEPDHIQTQLTYFAEDGVLADTEDKPADEAIVGPDNLEKFGHGSRDPNIVYVRNEKMDIDFEIVRAEGKYSEQVMGFLKHDDRPLRKFRLDDE